MAQTCEVVDCENLTSSYLCPHHIEALAQWQLQVTPQLLGMLKLIADKEEKPFGRPARRGKLGASGEEPINVEAWDLWVSLQQLPPAVQTAKQPGAKDRADKIVKDIQRAIVLVEGDTPRNVYDTAYLDRQGPLAPGQLAHWYYRRFGIQLTSNRIHQWHHRGRITPAYTKRGVPYFRIAAVVPLLTPREQRIIDQGMNDR